MNIQLTEEQYVIGLDQEDSILVRINKEVKSEINVMVETRDCWRNIDDAIAFYEEIAQSLYSLKNKIKDQI